MRPITHIRKNILGLNQKALAHLVGVSQSTVCRWDRGELEPNRNDMAAIRRAAIERGKPWDDSWFFEIAEAAE